MSRGEIPDDVRNFVLASIPSVSFLEALLQLRADAGREWNREQLAKKVYVSEEAAAALLARLHAEGFARPADGAHATYLYRPRSAALASIADRLAHTYARHLIEVSHLIHAKSGGAG